MDTNTQTPETRRLKKALRKTYRSKPKGQRSWFETAKIHNITGPDGKPSKALAYRIANGYEPHGLELRKRLGLQPHECPECGRRIKEVKIMRIWKHLDDLNAAEVSYIFEHREPA